jgi:hypothetical protein
MSESADPLSSFDFTTIDSMDPSLSGGHRVIYEREVPFELRVQQSTDAPQEAGTLEAVKVKLLLLGDEAAPAAFRVELTSENDVSAARGTASALSLALLLLLRALATDARFACAAAPSAPFHSPASPPSAPP